MKGTSFKWTGIDLFLPFQTHLCDVVDMKWNISLIFDNIALFFHFYSSFSTNFYLQLDSYDLPLPDSHEFFNAMASGYSVIYFYMGICDLNSWLLRCSTSRGSSTWLFGVGPTKSSTIFILHQSLNLCGCYCSISIQLYRSNIYQGFNLGHSNPEADDIPMCHHVSLRIICVKIKCPRQALESKTTDITHRCGGPIQ